MRVVLALAVALACVSAAQAGGWTVNANFSASVAMGVAATDSFAVIAGGDSGVGAQVWRSTDFGATWQLSELDAKPLMLMAAGAGGDDAVASGFVSVIHSDNGGKEYTKSSGVGATGPCQSAEAIKGVTGGFAVTGQALLFNGVSVSTDGGKTFNVHSVWGNNSTFAARYGAFPSANTWYVSAGSWPSNNARLGVGEVAVSERVRVQAGTNRARFVSHAEHTTTGSSNTTGSGYVAAIAKTTDGGKTFTTVFKDFGNFYFNGIDCWDDDHCAVVGEADSGAAPGARIYVTSDGGSSWTRTMYTEGAANSIMAVRYVSATELWAAGGEFVSGLPGHYHHSTDGGKTWTLVTVPNAYGTSLAFNNGHGYATIMTMEQLSGVATYSA